MKIIQYAFKRICKNAGITKSVNTHMLRHTFATRCIEAGVDLPVLQKLIGRNYNKYLWRYLQLL